MKWVTIAALAITAASWPAYSAWQRQRSAEAKPSVNASSPVESLQRELLRANLGQPGDPQLMAVYRDINSRHFAGNLPPIPVRWEARLDEAGTADGGKFTLEGMFGHAGTKAAILLHPNLRNDEPSLRRALVHEMIHASLWAAGIDSSTHGPEFQLALRRLATAHAFEGVVATDEERSQLRRWLDAESARLGREREELRTLAGDLERERTEIERAVAEHNGRVAARGGTVDNALATDATALLARRDAYNQRAAEAAARATQEQNDRDKLNAEGARYNLMLDYPDGLDARRAR